MNRRDIFGGFDLPEGPCGWWRKRCWLWILIDRCVLYLPRVSALPTSFPEIYLCFHARSDSPDLDRYRQQCSDKMKWKIPATAGEESDVKAVVDSGCADRG